MQIQIDQSSNRPVYQQIVDKVKREIALGHLAKDDKLPTVRYLASKLVINPNTIAKAYRQLEQQGIIVTRPGAGAFVAQLDNQLNESVRKKILCQQIELVAVEAVHMQVDKNLLVKWFNEAIEKFRIFRNGRQKAD